MLLFFALPLLCFPELFFDQNTLYSGDLTRIHYPLRILAVEQWKAGHVPLWNPYVLLGFPLLAEGQVGVLYPLNALFLLPIPNYRALTLFVTIHFTLAAIFTYGLARSWDIGRAGATLGGLSFGFGGFLMANVTDLNVMTGGVWLPLIFLFFSWALRVRSRVIALLGGIPLALQALTAQPQIIFYTVMLLISYALFETVRVSRNQTPLFSCPRKIANIWFFLILLAGSGFLLAAPQLLPTWELQRFSVRSAGLGYKDIVAYSLPPVQWLSLVLPSLFGNNIADGYKGLSASFTTTHVYVGMMPLVMACLSWRVRRRPEVFFLWLVIIIGFFLASGSYTPLYNFLQHMPIVNLFRVPGRWSLVVNFALAMLAALGFDAYIRQPGGQRLRFGLSIVWVVATAMMLNLWFFRELLSQGVANSAINNQTINTFINVLTRPSFFEVTDAYQDRLILKLLAWWVLPPVALVSRLGITVALLIAYPYFLSRRIFIIAAVIVTAFGLTLAGGSSIIHFRGADYWTQLSDGARYIIETERDNTARFLSQVRKPEEDVIAGLGQYFPSVHQVSNVWGHESPLNLERYVTLIQELEQFPMKALSLTATRFILTPEPLNPASRMTLPLVYEGEGWFVYENPVAPPRAFVVHQAIMATDGDKALNLLLDGNFDLRHQVILETHQSLPPLTAEVGTNDEVMITNYQSSSVEIETNLASNGFLILLDNWYPGWQVYVDGQQGTILRANYFARAVYLETGLHRVQFIYRPLSFRLGLALATLGLLVIGGTIWVEMRRKAFGGSKIQQTKETIQSGLGE